MPAVEPFGWQAQRKRLRLAAPSSAAAGLGASTSSSSSSAPGSSSAAAAAASGAAASRRGGEGGGASELLTVFREADDLEDEVEEERPAPSALRGQLEDVEAKRRRLTREGALLAEAERFAEALLRWEEALAFAADPIEKSPIYEQMAQVLMLMNRDFDAVRVAERAVESRPMWHCAHLTLGRALLNFGELERGVEALRRAASLEPGDEEAADELRCAERLRDDALGKATDCSKEVQVNGRVVQSRFWETALKVTYDAFGRPTTHFPYEEESPRDAMEG